MEARSIKPINNFYKLSLFTFLGFGAFALAFYQSTKSVNSKLRNLSEIMRQDSLTVKTNIKCNTDDEFSFNFYHKNISDSDYSYRDYLTFGDSVNFQFHLASTGNEIENILSEKELKRYEVGLEFVRIQFGYLSDSTNFLPIDTQLIGSSYFGKMIRADATSQMFFIDSNVVKNNSLTLVVDCRLFIAIPNGGTSGDPNRLRTTIIHYSKLKQKFDRRIMCTVALEPEIYKTYFSNIYNSLYKSRKEYHWYCFFYIVFNALLLMLYCIKSSRLIGSKNDSERSFSYKNEKLLYSGMLLMSLITAFLTVRVALSLLSTYTNFNSEVSGGLAFIDIILIFIFIYLFIATILFSTGVISLFTKK